MLLKTLKDKYGNVFQLPIIDITIVLYVACKYSFSFLLDSSFLLYILLCIFFFASQHKLLPSQLKEFFGKNF